MLPPWFCVFNACLQLNGFTVTQITQAVNQIYNAALFSGRYLLVQQATKWLFPLSVRKGIALCIARWRICTWYEGASGGHVEGTGHITFQNDTLATARSLGIRYGNRRQQ